MSFTQLQVKSSFSLLQSPITIKGLVDAAKARGYQALALTDVNVLYGSVDFYRQAKAAGIKPLIGLTIQIADADLVAIAQTDVGYHQLLKISSHIKLASDPVKLAALPDFSGLAVIVPGAYLLTAGFGDVWGSGDELLQAIHAKMPAQVNLGLRAQELTSELPAFANARQLPIVALGDVNYLEPNDAFNQKVLQAIAAGTPLNLRDPTLMDPGTQWLMPPEAAAQPFIDAGLEAAVQQSEKIAAQADVTIQFKQPQLPHFDTPNGLDAPTYLKQLATKGLQARFGQQAVPDDYAKRLDYELGVIDEMGFADYFLVVWDVMNHAHQVNIMTGPGRGSAAGALVAWALAITEVDPIKYHLLFERFLNPARAQMPDIDLDIPDNRRQELIEYVHQRYGDDHMAQIITFGTFGAKQALRDVARVFGLSQFESNKWSAAIPSVFHIDLKTAYDQSQPLRNLVSDSDQNQQLFATAVALEGLPRHDSTHAAGIVLAQEPLTDTVALQTGGDGIAQTQVPMGDVEALGLLKMDFLGLRNLSILATASFWVEKLTGKPFDPKTIPLDDAQTLQLFARGDTNGVFQFESSGIRRVLRNLKPTSFEDVVATNALYRPGPMENIDHFIARKQGTEPITYAAPALEPILKPTYGILVYQEQVMQVASAMGGFSLGEADLLRRAMSKKKQAVLKEERTRFLAGAQAKGYSQAVAETVYDYIDRFANYGFNRSHAVAYSMIAFWLAYLKCHFPTAFFAALMNTSLSNTEKLRIYVQELKDRQVPLYGPDINQSARYFTLQQQGIRFGLSTIKGVRRDFVEAILTARKNRPFKDLRDCLSRLDAKWLKKDTFAPLVYAGAFDSFDNNRAKTLANLDELIQSIALSGNNMELFAVLAPKAVDVPDFSPVERLDQEAAVLGVYLSGHPVDRYVQALKSFKALTAVADFEVNSRVTTVLVVRRIKSIRTKKGQAMAFIDGQDGTGSTSVTVFPQVFQRLPELNTGQVIVVAGKIESRDGLQVLADTVQLGNDALAQLPKAKLFLQLPENFSDQGSLLKTLSGAHGRIPVILVQQPHRQVTQLAEKFWVNGDSQLLQELQKQLGSANVVLQEK